MSDLLLITVTSEFPPQGSIKSCSQCVQNVSYLWLAVLFKPAEHAGGEFLKTAHWDRSTEGLEQGVHDVLKDVELNLVRHLIPSLLRVVLVGLHYVLIVPKRQNNHRPINFYVIAAILKKEMISHSFYTLDDLVCLNSKWNTVSIKIPPQHLKLIFDSFVPFLTFTIFCFRAAINAFLTKEFFFLCLSYMSIFFNPPQIGSS